MTAADYIWPVVGGLMMLAVVKEVISRKPEYPLCSGCDTEMKRGCYTTLNSLQYCQRCAEDLNLLPDYGESH